MELKAHIKMDSIRCHPWFSVAAWHWNTGNPSASILTFVLLGNGHTFSPPPNDIDKELCRQHQLAIDG